MFSALFTVSNVVKQGGVLSPVVFCIYICGLLHSVAESGVGCFISRVFVGALVHADHIVVLFVSSWPYLGYILTTDTMSGAPIGAGGITPTFRGKGDRGHNLGLIHISHI